MFRIRDHHLISILLVGAIICGTLAVVTGSGGPALASCGSGSGVVITSPSTSGGSNTTAPTLGGITSLRAATTPTTASGLTFMLLTSAQQTLGEAVFNSGNWRLDWDTRNVPNGPYQLVAVAHFGTATSLDCASASVPINIANTATQAPILAATITPSTWQGAVGTAANFSLDVLYTDQYGRQTHVTPAGVNWQSTLGTVGPSGGLVTTLGAGTVTGTGTLTATVGFSGLTTRAYAQIRVLAATTSGSGDKTTTATPAPTPTPIPTPTPTPKPASSSDAGQPTPAPTPLSSAEASRLAAMPTIFRPADPTNSDPVVNLPTLSCMEQAVGANRFAEISSGKSQPTAAERKLAAACFSGSEAVPAVLAPVAPLRLTELPTTSDIVKVGSVQSRVITTGTGEKISGFVLNGTAAPNVAIYIYVFSDPLVLRAESDSQGKWNYVLESSLPTGQHEVYAVAEQDSNTFVRTSAVPIQVAAASGTQDGALVVRSGWTSAQTSFALAAGLLVAMALFLLARLLRRRRATAPAVTGPAPTVIMPTNTPPNGPTV